MYAGPAAGPPPACPSGGLAGQAELNAAADGGAGGRRVTRRHHGRSYWGGGPATAGLVALVRRVEGRGGFTRLFAGPFAGNATSRRVLEKAGFGRDAVLRQSAVKHGRVVDQAFYSLTLPAV